MSSNSTKKLISEIPFFIRVYDDQTVERIAMSPYTHPSLHDPTTGISSKDVTISPNVSARLYLPKLDPLTPEKLPILVYFHGGGFIIGSAFGEYEHKYLNTMVAYVNALVVSVEYRLAPEHVVPVAYSDSWAALKWVDSHLKSPRNGGNRESWLDEYGDFGRVYVGGDSAGANIVHNLGLRLGKERLDNGLKVVGGFLGCPYFWSSKSTLNDDSLAYKCWMLANPNAQGRMDSPLINPFVGGRFEVEFGYKKLLVVVAEKDEMRDFGVEYFEAVKENKWDGEAEFLQIDGEDHCFYFVDSTSEKAKVLMARLASFVV